MKTTYRIRFRFGLGDTVLLTALARDIHRCRPGEIELMMDTSYSGIWHHNPNVTPSAPRDHAKIVLLRYRVQQPTRLHFLKHLYDCFAAQGGFPVPLTEPKGQLFLTTHEQRPKVTGRYWVVIPGGKLDMTTKFWSLGRWQEVVDELARRHIPCVQAGALHRNHVHPPLAHVVNMVDRTPSERDLAGLIANSEGVICGITSAMHIAACFDKPCVVIGGGREEPWWEAYTNAYPGAFGTAAQKVMVEHRYLHTVGQLDCCQEKGCWRPRTVPIDKQDMPPQGQDRLCLYPEADAAGRPVPKCMNMIEVNDVVEAVQWYYDTNVLPPIDPPRRSGLVEIHGQVPQVPPEPAISIPGPLPEAPIIYPTGPGPMAVNTRKALFGFDPQAPPMTPSPYAALLGKDATQEVPIDAGPASGTLDPQLPIGAVNDPIFDHPLIGGSLTVFVLCYGDYPGLAKRCINSILRTTPAGRIKLRVLCNECSQETLDYVSRLPYTEIVYVDSTNLLKYPMMRRAFYDPHFPIKTKYLLWFDDDSYAADHKWLKLLCQQIIDNHPKGCRLFGWEYMHDLNTFAKDGHRPDQWFTQATWHRGEQFLARKGMPAPNGSLIPFVAGGFWALNTEVMKQAQIPDGRLTHHGGDIVIGAQVIQAGYSICNWNIGKKYVHSSGHEPRGMSVKPSGNKPYPWKR